jgi:hypothetical protein
MCNYAVKALLMQIDLSDEVPLIIGWSEASEAINLLYSGQIL